MSCQHCPRDLHGHIRGLPLCAYHYAEALDHGADIVRDYTEFTFDRDRILQPIDIEYEVSASIARIKRKKPDFDATARGFLKREEERKNRFG